jgi:hypothetical protein
MPRTIFCLISIFLLLVVACENSDEDTGGLSEEIAVVGRDVEAAPASEVDSAPKSGPNCSWSWATERLDELSDLLQDEMDVADIDGEGYAEAYGENYICDLADDPTTFEVVRFAAMETNVDITLRSVNLGDAEALGDEVAATLKMLLDQFPPDRTPGPRPGRINLNFESSGETGQFTVGFSEAEEALSTPGLEGEALLATLGYSVPGSR